MKHLDAQIKALQLQDEKDFPENLQHPQHACTIKICTRGVDKNFLTISHVHGGTELLTQTLITFFTKQEEGHILWQRIKDEMFK